MGRIGTIINRKGKQDAKKSKIFSKLARAITVAAKEGGGDPHYNASLQTAIDKAKAENMPNDNIERAIKKGTGGGDDVSYTSITYEGYGPGGIAVLVECLTDNLNRTAADVRSYFVKCKGNLGTNGCVSYLFDKKGLFVINKTKDLDISKLEEDAIEAGVESFEDEGDYIEILTDPVDFASVSKTLKSLGYNFEIEEIRFLPQTFSSLESEEDEKYMHKLLDLFEDNDDVQNVYHNFTEKDSNN